jgi:hypothetical protein
MTRALNTGFATAIQAGHVNIFPLVDFAFASGASYLCGLDHAVTWNGNTYLPALGLLEIAEVQETPASAQGLSIKVSGVSSASIALALNEKVQGRLVTVRMAVIDSAGALQVDANVWQGMMDMMQIMDGGDSAIVNITAEHIMATWDRPRTVRYTDAQQQALYPGDLGLQYVAQMESATIVWPARAFFLK